MVQANITKEGLHSQCNIQMSNPGDVDMKCYGRLTLFQFPNAETAPAAVTAVEVGSPAISCLCFCHFKRAPTAQLTRLPLISPLFFLSFSLSLNHTSTDLTFPNLVGFFFFFQPSAGFQKFAKESRKDFWYSEVFLIVSRVWKCTSSGCLRI